MMNANLVLKTVKNVGIIATYIGIGTLAGVTAYPAFKRTLGVKKITKIEDIPMEEILPDMDFGDDEDDE